jgi:hypothetical protein
MSLFEPILVTAEDVLNQYVIYQKMMADPKLDEEYVSDKGKEMIKLFFEMLHQTDNPSVFQDQAMQDWMFEFFTDIFSEYEETELQQQILNALYEVGKAKSNYDVLERTLVLLTTFRDKEDYLELVEYLNHVNMDYRALKIIKNTSLYYLV